MKLNVKQVLSEAASLYKEKFAYLIVISLFNTGINVISQISQAIQRTESNPTGMLLILALLVILAALAVIIISPKVTMAVIIAINSLLDKKSIRFGEAFRQTRGKYWTYIGNLLIVGLLYMPVLLPVIFLKIPFGGTINSIYSALVGSLFFTLIPMISIEPKSEGYIAKSFQQGKGNYLPVLLIYILTGSSLGILYSVAIGLFVGKTALLVIRIVYSIITLFLYPFSQIALIIVYRQLRKGTALRYAKKSNVA
jgi:hypothetical protein